MGYVGKAERFPSDWVCNEGLGMLSGLEGVFFPP